MKTINFRISPKIADYLIQAIFICLSVFLGFWLNDYKNQQEAQKFSDKAKSAILVEMKANLAMLEQIQPEHTALL